LNRQRFGRIIPAMTKSISPTAADLSPDASTEERIIALRQDGLSVAGIAKRLQIPHQEVHATIPTWSASYFGPNRRPDMLAIVTARLERLYQAHKEKAHKGDTTSAHICLKVCAHLSAMHGLYQPAISAINNVHNSMLIDATPRQTSTDRIEAALNQLVNSETPAVRAERLRRELRRLEHQPSDDELEAETNPVKAEAVEAAE
jgi:DNA-binding transcriptional MerR regulator